MRRFYREVATAPAADGHRVLLDGRPVQTPGRRQLSAPSPGLAAAIAGEWRMQRETIVPATMPITRLASTAVDRMPTRRRDAIEEITAYAGTELLCYRAAEPEELVRRQEAVWQPLLDWAARVYGAPLVTTTTLAPAEQPPAALAGLRAPVERLDDWPLVGVHAATTALGSIVLGLALLEGRLDADAAVDASLLDELFEIERWGQDRETVRRHQALRRDVAAAGDFLAGLS